MHEERSGEQPLSSGEVDRVVDAIKEQTRLARRTKRRFIIAGCVIAYLLFVAYNEGCDRSTTVCRPTYSGGSVCEREPPK